MTKLIIGLILVILLLVPISCALETTGSRVEEEGITQTEEEEKPTLTEEQQELWVERGVVPVSTIEEASRLVGYQVAIPTFIPEGFLPGDFELNQLGFPPQLGGEWGDGKRVVQRQWTWSGDRKIHFLVMQFQGTEESVQGEPSDVCGHSGKRELFEAEKGREYPLLVLHWWDSERVYSVSGLLGDPLTEEILHKIACSVPEDRK